MKCLHFILDRKGDGRGKEHSLRRPWAGCLLERGVLFLLTRPVTSSRPHPAFESTDSTPRGRDDGISPAGALSRDGRAPIRTAFSPTQVSVSSRQPPISEIIASNAAAADTSETRTVSHHTPDTNRLTLDASAMHSSAMDSPHERAYGTFEVSVIEVDSDSEHAPLQPTKSTNFDAQDEAARHTCVGDCCVVVSFLWMPLRLETYKIVLFHGVNALFAIGAAVWTVLFYTLKFALSPMCALALMLRNLEAATLRVLLHADAVLFNFVCPRAERIRVYNSPTGTYDDASVYTYSAQIYFAVGKLVCSAAPGAIAALTFLWTLRNFVVVLTAGGVASSPDDPMAPVENDVLILFALVAVYAAAALTKVFAVISRHITIFFCAEYLLYAAPL